MLVRRFILFLDDRLASGSFTKNALRKAFPDHWSFMLGEIAMYAFIFLLATGTYLAFLFDPSDQQISYSGPYVPLDGEKMSIAYASSINISFAVKCGLLFRQMHHWGALLFVGALTVHALRVFFTGAFRKPRDVNWLFGVTLMVLAMAEGFMGYSLPDDLLSGTGLRIAYSIAQSIPIVGDWLAFLFFGGKYPSDIITPRLYIMHVWVLPAAIGGVIAIHLGFIWRQKHSQFRGPGRTEHNVVGSPLWAHYTMKSLGLQFMVFSVLAFLGAFFQINPIWLYGPYDPWTIASPAQPDWYVGWLDGALRLGPRWSWSIWGHTVAPAFFPAIALPACIFAIFYGWPWIERLITRDHRHHNLDDLPWEVPWRVGVGVGVLTFIVILLLGGSDDVQAHWFRIVIYKVVIFYRVALWILPIPFGLLAAHICREIKARRTTQAGHSQPKRVMLVRGEDGGYEEERAPIGASE